MVRWFRSLVPPGTGAAALEGGPADAAVTLVTGTALTAWALAYEASPLALSLLQSVFVGMQIAQPVGAWLVQRMRGRVLPIAAVLVSRLSWLVMSAAALLEAPSEVVLPLLFAVAALSALANVIRENAIGTWLGDIVPAHARGRFFAQRSRVGVVFASLASFLMASLFDGQLGPRALAGLAAIVALLGLVSAALFARMPPPHPPPASPRTLREAWSDRSVHPYVHYHLAYAFALSPGLAFFSYWVLDRNGGTFFVLSAHALLLALTRIVVAPAMGRWVDRHGSRLVLTVCAAGTALPPLLWMAIAPGRLWPLAVDAVVAGVLWGGYAIAIFDLPLRIAPPSLRPQVLALGAVAAGLGWLLGSLFFGRLAEHLEAAGVSEPLRWIFGICALGRAAAGLLALRITGAGPGVPAAAWAEAGRA
jgi:MFS family permease